MAGRTEAGAVAELGEERAHADRGEQAAQQEGPPPEAVVAVVRRRARVRAAGLARVLLGVHLAAGVGGERQEHDAHECGRGGGEQALAAQRILWIRTRWNSPGREQRRAEGVAGARPRHS